MNKPAFTKWPWILDEYTGCMYDADGDEPIMTIGGGYDGERLEEYRANTYLLVTAPELYEVLQELVDGPCATFDVEYLPLMRRVVAALAKARGESSVPA